MAIPTLSSLISLPAGLLPSPPTLATAFKFTSATPPIPAKLVTKVRSLQYVDMAEFLPDNVGVLKSLDAAPLAQLLPATRPRLREIKSLLSWVTSFCTYTAILASSHPHLVESRLAYMALVIREARKNGGEGWRAYDQIFRQNAAMDPTADWARVDASLYAATFLVQRTTAGLFCKICCDTDHEASDCALLPYSAAASQDSSTQVKSDLKASPKERPSRFGSFSIPICISWNRGSCLKAPNCRYRHVCASCPGNHPAIECPRTPPDSLFKRRGAARPPPTTS